MNKTIKSIEKVLEKGFPDYLGGVNGIPSPYEVGYNTALGEVKVLIKSAFIGTEPKIPKTSATPTKASKRLVLLRAVCKECIKQAPKADCNNCGVINLKVVYDEQGVNK